MGGWGGWGGGRVSGGGGWGWSAVWGAHVGCAVVRVRGLVEERSEERRFGPAEEKGERKGVREGEREKRQKRGAEQRERGAVPSSLPGQVPRQTFVAHLGCFHTIGRAPRRDRLYTPTAPAGSGPEVTIMQ